MGELYRILPNFLGKETQNRLLEYTLANENRFEHTTVGDGKVMRQDHGIRISRCLTDLGVFQALFEQRVLQQVPALALELGMTPFQPSGVETEIVAHGNGAFYKRHIDVFTGAGRTPQGEDRLLTVVYYFFRGPRSFKGGALRLYPLPSVDRSAVENGIDIEVEQDTAVAFPSWVPHEVLKISCPSGEFADSRFAVNCWVLRAKNTPKA